MMLLVATALALAAPQSGVRPWPAGGVLLQLNASTRLIQLPPCCTTDPTPPPVAPTVASPFLPPCCATQGSIDLLPPCCTSRERDRERDVDEWPDPHKEQHAKRRLHPMGQLVAPAPTHHLEGGAVAELEPERVAKVACCAHTPQPAAVVSAERNRIDIIASLALLGWALLALGIRKTTVRVVRKPLPRDLLPSTLMTQASIDRLRNIEPRAREAIDA